jgi:uncharacterized protein
MALDEKIEDLKNSLRELESVLIAYSGGVDSTFLMAVAAGIPDIDVMAVTASNSMIPNWEVKEARKIAKRLKVKHKIIKTDPLSNPLLKKNPKDRCYICKKSIFISFLNLAQEAGYSYVADGTNYDDLGVYRPGLKALKELGIKSPLADAGLTKVEIRTYSKDMGLPTWDAPALACLATRIPYDEELTEAKLKMIDESESYLRSLGFRQLRVRYHYPIARIELGTDEMPHIMEPDIKSNVVQRLKAIGFNHIVIDLEGYRSGSMDLLAILSCFKSSL